MEKTELFAPCPYCTGIFTGLPDNACENCMNSGYKHNGAEYEVAREQVRTKVAGSAIIIPMSPR